MLYRLHQSEPETKAGKQRTNQHDKRVEKLLARIEVNRAHIEEVIRQCHDIDHDTSERARSLLLYLEGCEIQEIAAMTGLSATAVLRVRRRFEVWGLACISDPAPLSSKRTSAGDISRAPAMLPDHGGGFFAEQHKAEQDSQE